MADNLDAAFRLVAIQACKDIVVGQTIPLLDVGAFGLPLADKGIVVLSAHQHTISPLCRDRATSSLFTGTVLSTMLPMVPSFLFRVTSFSTAAASSSFFSFSSSIFLARSSLASSFAYAHTTSTHVGGIPVEALPSSSGQFPSAYYLSWCPADQPHTVLRSRTLAGTTAATAVAPQAQTDGPFLASSNRAMTSSTASTGA